MSSSPIPLKDDISPPQVWRKMEEKNGEKEIKTAVAFSVSGNQILPEHGPF